MHTERMSGEEEARGQEDASIRPERAYFTHGILYLLIPYSFIAPPSSPPSAPALVTTTLFSVSVNLLLFFWLYSLVLFIYLFAF